MSALISHTYMSRSMFDMDLWLNPNDTGLGQTTLDLFDPFDDLDRIIGRNFNWLCKPEFLNQPNPRFPNKFRVKLNCSGFNSESIKTEIIDNKLIVTGNEGNKQNESEDFSLKQFRKTIKLPGNTENDKMASFMTSSGHLVIEIPIKEETKNEVGDLFPRISDDKKNVNMNLALPESLDPNKLKVTCKDRQLVISYQNKTENEESYSDVHYYKQVLMPENTDFTTLKCVYENKLLKISAPLISEFKKGENQINIQIINAKK